MDPFTLDDTPKPEPEPNPEPPEPTRQTTLFSGLDCLAGQLDLFQPDGEEDPP